MQRLLKTAMVAAAAVSLAVPASAAAKEITQATVCGASRCNTITDRSELRGLPFGGDYPTEPPTSPSRYYRVEVTIDHGSAEDRFAFYYVPAARAVATGGEVPGSVAWFPIYGSAALDSVRRATKGLEGYPAPKRWPTTLASFERLSIAAPNASSGGHSWLYWLGIASALAAALAVAAVVAVRLLPVRPLRRRPTAA